MKPFLVMSIDISHSLCFFFSSVGPGSHCDHPGELWNVMHVKSSVCKEQIYNLALHLLLCFRGILLWLLLLMGMKVALSRFDFLFLGGVKIMLTSPTFPYALILPEFLDILVSSLQEKSHCLAFHVLFSFLPRGILQLLRILQLLGILQLLLPIVVKVSLTRFDSYSFV